MKHAYLLKEIRILNPDESFIADLRVRNGQVQQIGVNFSEDYNEVVLDGNGLIASPGLINSHDHLQFNLYPHIGEPPYGNAYEWGNDILTRWRPTVQMIERVPVRLRYLWGAWKNLFSGVTSVVHHDPFSAHFRLMFPIDVLQRYTFAHSLGNEPNLKRRLDERRISTPFMIHLAEGRDERAAGEVKMLGDLGGLDERTVAIHATNISLADIDIIKEAGTSVVWCPSSNFFLFNKTAPIHSLWGKVRVALGTDSTLTGQTTLFDEMRTAQQISGLAAKDIFSLVTESPQRIFGLSADAGTIRVGGRANLFLLQENGSDPYETILRANPEDILLLLRNGRPVFHDPAALPYLENGAHTNLRFNHKVKHIHQRQCLRLYQRLRALLKHYSYLSMN